MSQERDQNNFDEKESGADFRNSVFCRAETITPPHKHHAFCGKHPRVELLGRYVCYSYSNR